ncbi:hypothetical protein T01_9006 [Trichinella spiralis]|uniref:Uncharacterized protein n=1 Tax=Trichinella spiralis TaxID=6334 RepID=A0A0V1BK52_TRISP|nr:hypothetical protein T01_9006 [Trichinella spiralis]
MHAHTPKSVLYSTLQLIIAQHFLHLLNLNKCTATALSAFFAAAAAICLSYFGRSADMLSYKKFTTVISVCLIFENEAKFMDTGRRKCIICQGCIFFKLNVCFMLLLLISENSRALINRKFR